jgi:hypothetical protein
MSATLALLSDGPFENTSTPALVPQPAPDWFTVKLSSNEKTETKKSGQVDLNTKITSFYTPTSASDPFKSVYREEWRAHVTTKDPVPAPSQSTAPPASLEFLPGPTASPDTEVVTNLTGKFQNITLQRVIALRKVQHAIQSAPNASAVGAHSTSFSEDDLQCLTMEELQALQKRKRAIHTEMQPLSVVKVSIQAERSRKRLEPRDYQLELYERARRENTIAVLGTGTGKTLIACLLIKDILIQERVRRTAGEKVPLVVRNWLNGNRRRFAFLSCLWCILCFNRAM